MTLYWIALTAVILVDALCLKYLLTKLFSRNDIKLPFWEAFLGTLICAVMLGIVLLDVFGKLAILPLFMKMGCSEKLALIIWKNLYYTFMPFLNALSLIVWTKISPRVNLGKFYPDALVAGIILHYIDIGIIVPWFFRLTAT